MRNWFKYLWTALWINPTEERTRDVRTQRVHARAERAMNEADSLIESYRQADLVMRKHQKIWRQNKNV